MGPLTECQQRSWPEAVRLIREGYHVEVPEDLTEWDMSWREGASPGQGNDFVAAYLDGENLARVQMDGYGQVILSVATLAWQRVDSPS